MPDEIEIATEHLQDTISEELETSGEPWLLRVALTAALLSACAAITSTVAGHFVNQAMMAQIEASDAWANYQAKSIKALVLKSKIEMLGAMGRPTNEPDSKKLSTYGTEEQEISARAKAAEVRAENCFSRHEGFARATTAFQIAISVCAISALTRARFLWRIGLAAGAIGLALIFIAL